MKRAAPLTLVLALGLPGVALAHEERPVRFPSGAGSVPSYRTTGPALTVCRPESSDRIREIQDGDLREWNEHLLEECEKDGFRDLQAAIDAVEQPGTRILLLPGVYRENPSLGPPSAACAPLADKFPLSYEEQVACPHLQNLVTIFGDGPDEDIACDNDLCGLQVEGTGVVPEDVILDGQFRKLNVLRADRADGVFFRNFTVQRAEFNSVYVIETDGFVIDRMLARWNDEYAFLTFASDHGLYDGCEAYGNGDGGLYPGSAADHHATRWSIEIRNCESHHNTIGVSGTAGNSIYVHDNDLHDNMVGVTLDSFFPDHPGLPQDAARFEHNRIRSNNQNYYPYYSDGTCQKPLAERGYEQGVVCPSVPVPVGTGIMVAGGNANVFVENEIFDNWRFGTMQFVVPAAFRNEMDPLKQFDTSHFNSYLRNRMGIGPSGAAAPNGLDFWWDVEGEGNCWEGNVAATGRSLRSDPPILPTCDLPDVFTPGNLAKVAAMAPCATWSREDHHPVACDWMQSPARPS